MRGARLLGGRDQQNMTHALKLVAQWTEGRHASRVGHVETAGVIVNVDRKKRLEAP